MDVDDNSSSDNSSDDSSDLVENLPFIVTVYESLTLIYAKLYQLEIRRRRYLEVNLKTIKEFKTKRLSLTKEERRKFNIINEDLPYPIEKFQAIEMELEQLLFSLDDIIDIPIRVLEDLKQIHSIRCQTERKRLQFDKMVLSNALYDAMGVIPSFPPSMFEDIENEIEELINLL